MSEPRAEDVLDRFSRFEIGPIEAADELIASGQFMVGSAGAHESMAESEQAVRFQALLGRLKWVFLERAGATELPSCTSVEDYREFYLRTHDEEDL